MKLIRRGKKAVFLDRDGVLNVKRDDYVKSEDELIILPNIDKELIRLRDNGYQLIIITNQSVINRGIIAADEELKINKKLLDYLLSHGVKISKIYVCPHRPDENCLCRKPNTGMIDSAVKEFQIDLKKSWFIGDSESDMEVAKQVGCNFFKVGIKTDLKHAVDHILFHS